MLYLHRIDYLHEGGQLAGRFGRSYIYAHDREEARVLANRDIFSRFPVSLFIIKLLTEPERTTYALLTPQIDQPFNGGSLPEHERGREAFVL